jgi:hypothetical protein
VRSVGNEIRIKKVKLCPHSKCTKNI